MEREDNREELEKRIVGSFDHNIYRGGFSGQHEDSLIVDGQRIPLVYQASYHINFPVSEHFYVGLSTRVDGEYKIAPVNLPESISDNEGFFGRFHSEADVVRNVSLVDGALRTGYESERDPAVFEGCIEDAAKKAIDFHLARLKFFKGGLK